ncbi:MAG: helix-hairpin-helix domain-containing protein [Anaerolineales bacterium]|jgi:competence protein ComEA
MREKLIYILFGTAFGIIGGLLASGIIYLTSSQPIGEPIKLNPAPTSAPIIVNISGAVQNPGVYTLPDGSRINNLVDTAGGFLPSAGHSVINLARLLQDGETIHIPEEITSTSILFTSTQDTRAAINQVSPKININHATQSELESLPGIGEKKALQIIAYREENGFFESIDQIQKVPGIGVTTFNKIQALITVNGNY